MKNFPRFWFDGNLFFGWINNADDLQKLFHEYDGHMTKDEVLDKSVNLEDGVLNNFGLRGEYNGSLTLRQFLTDNDVEI